MSDEKEEHMNLEQLRRFLLDQIEAVKIDAKRASSDSIGALEIAEVVDKDSRETRIENWKTRIFTVMQEYSWHLSMLLLVFLFSDLGEKNKKESLLQRLTDLIKLSTSSHNKIVGMKDDKEIASSADEFYEKWDQIRQQIKLQVSS